MVYCKKLFILFLILFIFLFNFSSCFASENVELTQVNGIIISTNSNAFVSSTDGVGNVKYFLAEVGNRYTIHNGYNNTRLVASSSGVPALNVPYTIISQLSSNDIYTFVPSENVYVALGTSDVWSVEVEKIESFDNSITNLVENVGPNSLWGVFGDGIDFVFVIVIVAFGLFIIYKLIKGFSKGKSKI